MPEFAGPSRREEVEHFLDEKVLHQALRRKKPTRIFWLDMSDLFGAWVPDEWIDQCFAVMALTPHHSHQILTKRPERMRDYIGSTDRAYRVMTEARSLKLSFAAGQMSELTPWPLLNVWLGTSVEDQQRADERIPLLLQTPAAVRFLSCEPLLGPVDLRHLHHDGIVEIDALTGDHGVNRPLAGRSDNRVHWIITGAESGPRRREYRPEWDRAIQQQCQDTGVAFFRKQMIVDGRVSHDPSEWPQDMRIREFPKVGT